jgi:hypothetical protein
MGCLESLPYEIVMSRIAFSEARDAISRYREKYTVPPGYEIFGVRLIGVPPVIIAVDGNTVLFPYTKPCHGTFLIRVPDAGEEITKLRAKK